MKFVIKLISSTFANLIDSGYLAIVDKEQRVFKILNLTIWSKEKYLIKLLEKPRQTDLTGWLEDKIFKQFDFSNLCYLDKIVYDVLNDILSKNKTYINPGKAILLEIIKNQKLNILEFKQTFKWFSIFIEITFNNELETDFINLQLKTDYLNLTYKEFCFFKKAIRDQLKRFKNTD